MSSCRAIAHRRTVSTISRVLARMSCRASCAGRASAARRACESSLFQSTIFMSGEHLLDRQHEQVPPEEVEQDREEKGRDRGDEKAHVRAVLSTARNCRRDTRRGCVAASQP